MFEGKEYDHVFHIDIDEGVVLKLPYNCTEEPYHSAQSFIHKHNLPQEYLDQVAQFIIKNSTRTNVNNSVGSACDPFTGMTHYYSLIEITQSLNIHSFSVIMVNSYKDH